MINDHTQQPPPTEPRLVHAAPDVLRNSSLGSTLDRAAYEWTTNTKLGSAGGSASRSPESCSIAALVFGDLSLAPPTSAVSKDVRFSSPTANFAEALASCYSLGKQQRRLVTDGGPQKSAENSQQQLQDLFCTVTGTDEVTEQQENDNRRVVAEEGEESIAGAVAAVAREDGLDDTLPEPDGSD